jgi:hypothetical protein
VTKVVVEPAGSFESAIQRFKRQCEKAGLVPGQTPRTRKALAARKKAKRRERTSD